LYLLSNEICGLGLQVLNGEKPANTDPIRVDTVPGTQWRYSGGGVTIEQLLMTDVTGEAFPSLMHKLVLDKVMSSHTTPFRGGHDSPPFIDLPAQPAYYSSTP
jgi:CubicO group peptidase (beta-lactamase class C family)